MKRRVIEVVLVAVAVVLALNVRIGYAKPNTAPSAGVYEIAWYTVDAGGAQDLSGGTYTLSGTAGQPDAGTTLSSESYTLVGGFWASSVAWRIYLPLVLR